MKTPPADMLALAKNTLPNAYAPYSHFSVAAVVRSADATLFAGCNIENAAFPMGLCAEASAIGALFTCGYQKITEALVLVDHHKICPPCGACRQRFVECADQHTLIHLCTLSGVYQSYTLTQLMPHAFHANNLEELS